MLQGTDVGDLRGLCVLWSRAGGIQKQNAVSEGRRGLY